MRAVIRGRPVGRNPERSVGTSAGPGGNQEDNIPKMGSHMWVNRQLRELVRLKRAEPEWRKALDEQAAQLKFKARAKESKAARKRKQSNKLRKENTLAKFVMKAKIELGLPLDSDSPQAATQGVKEYRAFRAKEQADGRAKAKAKAAASRPSAGQARV